MHRRVALGRARALGAIVASMTLVATLSFTGVSQATPADTAGTDLASSEKAAEPTWTVALASDPATGATVAPGAEVGITLTVSNTGAVDLPAGAEVISDLGEPLAHTSIAEPAKLAAAGLALEGTKLTWTVPGITAKGAAQTKFSLTVAGDADGSTLSIAATPQGAEKCAVAACETTLTVAAPAAESSPYHQPHPSRTCPPRSRPPATRPRPPTRSRRRTRRPIPRRSLAPRQANPPGRSLRLQRRAPPRRRRARPRPRQRAAFPRVRRRPPRRRSPRRLLRARLPTTRV